MFEYQMRIPISIIILSCFSIGSGNGTPSRMRRSAAEEKTNGTIWDMPIHYSLDNSSLSPKTLQLLREVMDYIEARTCLQFTEGNGTDMLVFTKTDQPMCISDIGKQGGKQLVQISENPTEGCVTFSLLSHELFHSLGLNHETMRPDRDAWLTVDDDNVQYPTQFAKKPQKLYWRSFGYDIGSVMQYNNKYLQKDPGKNTFEVKDKDMAFWVQPYVKTYAKPSFNDIKILNDRYGCIDKCGATQCSHSGYQAGPKCECQCPDGLSGSQCDMRSKGTETEMQTADQSGSACGETFTNKSGEFSSPAFAKSLYDTTKLNQTCSWLISAQEDEWTHLSFFSDMYIDNIDGGSQNYLEIHRYGITVPGLRLSGTKDTTRMAYVVNGPGLVQLGVKNTNGYAVGFQASYQVFKYMDYQKYCNNLVCYNGGALQIENGKCTCKCRSADFQGDQCEHWSNSQCAANNPCQNGGKLNLGKPDCPCDCPQESKVPLLGNKCQYFGECHSRGNTTILNLLKVKPTDDICSDGECDSSLQGLTLCPSTCKTQCQCSNFLDTVKSGTCKEQAASCADDKTKAMMAVGCGDTCNTCH